MAYSASTTEPAEDDADALFLRLKGEVVDDRRECGPWYREARLDFGMYAGGDAQWEPEDLERIEAELKPHATFNFILPSVNAVNGMEVSNRQEVTFLPRTTQSAKKPAPVNVMMPGAPQGQPQPVPGADDTGPAEALTAGGKYFRQECDAEDEESDAFQDTSICGMGWTETRIDFDDAPEGQMLVDRCDPLEMGWDSRASKRNLIDSRRFHRVREMDKASAEEMFPGYECEEIDAVWARPQLTEEPTDREQAREYENKQDNQSSRKTVTVVEITWFEREITHEVADLKTGAVTKGVTTEQLKKLRERAKTLEMDIAVKKVSKKVFKYAFLGNSKILADSAKDRREGTPCQSQKGFKFNAITGTRDRNRRQWMGIVRAMRDPQRWTNALYSSTLNSVMTGGKGIMAERDAFENPNTAEADWASNSKIVWLKLGALSGPNPKVQQKVPSALPPGIDRLMEFALAAMRGVSGVNLEMLGGADREQAASLEYQRRQAATTILAPFFDGLRRYRKSQGRVMLDLIRLYLSDGRLIRIVGPDYEGYVPLIRDESVTEFDIIVAESPSSPNQKEASWQTIQQVLPMMSKNLSPKTGAILLKASPLPLSVVKEFQDAARTEQEEMANQPPPPEVQLTMAQVEKTKAETVLKQEEAKVKQIETVATVETTRMDMEDRDLERQDRGAQRQHDVVMRDKELEGKRMEMQGASDQEFAKSAGPGMAAQMAELGKGLMVLAEALSQGLAAQSRAIGQLAQATAAPRESRLQFGADGMPIGAVSMPQTVQ